jgi:hypothetical protein
MSGRKTHHVQCPSSQLTLRQPFYRRHPGPFHWLCTGRTVLLRHRSLRHRHLGLDAAGVTILRRSLLQRLGLANAEGVPVCRTLFLSQHQAPYRNKADHVRHGFSGFKNRPNGRLTGRRMNSDYSLINLLDCRAGVRAEARVEMAELAGTRSANRLRATERLDGYG